MAAHGSLNTMPLAELLGWVHNTSRTGTVGVNERETLKFLRRLMHGGIIELC